MERLSLLLLEDMAEDAELIIRMLQRSEMEFDAVITDGRDSFLKAITCQSFDVILADNSLPQFSAIEALKIINERKLTTPFILVTGSISEEYAVEIMKEGACDYILKDRLQRLPNAVLNALHKHRLEAERKKYLAEVIANEALLKEAARLARFGSWEIDIENKTERWSDEQYRILGHEPGETEPSLENFLNKVHPGERARVRRIIDHALTHLDRQKYDCRIVIDDGSVKHISAEIAIKRENGRALRINGFILDVSDSRHAELKEKKITDDLIQRNKDLEQFTYIVSHNLRAPVANIVGVSNALIDGDLNRQEHVEFMEALALSVKKLDNVIIDLNDILQAKDTINEMKEKIYFSEIVDDIKYSISGFLGYNSFMIKSDFTAVNNMFTLKSYMHSIFYNLISNSIKFRQPERGAIIEIKSEVNHDKIELTFKDNSIGIDLDKYKDQIFGLYKRFHPEYAEGKGMGLFMVKTQVETLGGNISVSSKVNEGVEFKIELYNSH